MASASPATARAAGAGSQSPSVSRHQVNGCGRTMTLYTPQTPGAGLPASALGLPRGPHTIMAVAAQRHVRWLTTLRCRARPMRHRFLPAGPHNAAGSSNNWSGYEDTTPGTPNYAQAFWTMPQLGGPNSATATDYSSVWPGIGDGNGGELIQDGSEQDVSCVVLHNTCQEVVDSYYFWLETFPGENQEEVTNLVPNEGDSVAAAVYWSSSTGAEFTLCDYTQNTCVTGSQSSSAPDDTAEWIVERTGICQNGYVSLPSLAPFGKVTITNGGFDETPQNSLEYTIGDGYPNAIDMYDVNGTQLDSTGGLSGGTSFSVTWDAYGATSNTNISC
jgi:hypothetical protein